jgi:hypothetical protein
MREIHAQINQNRYVARWCQKQKQFIDHKLPPPRRVTFPGSVLNKGGIRDLDDADDDAEEA